jgi:signal transduction histidine kinase
MTTSDAPREEASAPEDPELRLARALQRQVGRRLAAGFLALGVASCAVLGGNAGLWLLWRGLRVETIPAPAILLPFSVAGWLHARRGGLSRAAQHAWFLLGATVPLVALLVNLRRDPLEAVQAAGITIWLYPFCIAVTVLALDRGLSHWTAVWCAAQYVFIHGLAVASQGESGPTAQGGIHSADGLVRVVALLLAGFAAGHANHLARETIRKLVDEEQRARDARMAAIRAEERGRAAAAFLARMSHELKTPLHIILGNADLLLSRGDLEREQRLQVEAARMSGRHLLGLVEAVLEQGKLSSGRPLALFPSRVEVEPLLSQIEVMLREKAVARGLRLRIERERSAPDWIHADPLRLRQVLLGLLDNGLKYTESGEIGLRVCAGDGPSELRFEVCDTGRGIPAEDLERVFEPFYQGRSESEAPGGVGLGLSIARALVSAMGGRLELQSDPGKGSRFLVTLPLPDAPAAAADRDVVQLPEALRSTLLHWAERGNMAELRRAALAAAANDPALGPFCEQLRAAADAFDDAAARRLLQAGAPRGSEGEPGA